ncbi:TPA: hypothetical protein ACHUBL_004486, partial [Escherichia coli]
TGANFWCDVTARANILRRETHSDTQQPGIQGAELYQGALFPGEVIVLPRGQSPCSQSRALQRLFPGPGQSG